LKRITALLLLSLTFLYSCSNVAPPDNSAVVTDDVERTEKPPVFYIDGELPEIGEFTGKSQKDRFYNEYTPYFIPSDMYGTVLPYIGGVKEYKTTYDEEWVETMIYCSYGLCNAEGKIIMDAQEAIDNAYHHVSPDGFGYYQLNFMDESAYDEPKEMYPVGKSVLVPDHGKWMLELPKASYTSSIDGGRIAVMVPTSFNEEHGYPDGYKAVFYNYDGEKLFEIENADYIGESFGGLTKVSGIIDGNRYEWLIDNSGEMIFGPFESIYNVGDVANVKDIDGTCYLMNTKGERITQKEYHEINIVYSGLKGFSATFYTDDGRVMRDIISSDGKLLCTIECDKYPDITITPGNIVIYSYCPTYGSDKIIYKYGDGTDFVSKEYGTMPNRYSSGEGLFWYENEETGESVVFGADGETVFKAHELNYMYQMEENERYLTYSTGNVEYIYDEELEKSVFTSTAALHLFDKEKNETVLSIKDGGYGTFVGADKRYFLYTITTDYDSMGGKSQYSLYDTQEGKIIFENCPVLSHQSIDGKSYYNVYTKNYCALYDENFNVILKTIIE